MSDPKEDKSIEKFIQDQVPLIKDPQCEKSSLLNRYDTLSSPSESIGQGGINKKLSSNISKLFKIFFKVYKISINKNSNYNKILK